MVRSHRPHMRSSPATSLPHTDTSWHNAHSGNGSQVLATIDQKPCLTLLESLNAGAQAQPLGVCASADSRRDTCTDVTARVRSLA
jgi:hypothetical protein